MITRNPSLTDQVKANIKDRIVNDGFDEGRIPPETELATDLGVSRTTVRDALSRLEHEGTIYRRQGSGTFVNEPGLQIRSRLEDIWSYEQVLEDHGYVPSVRVLSSPHPFHSIWAMNQPGATPHPLTGLGAENAPGIQLVARGRNRRHQPFQELQARLLHVCGSISRGRHQPPLFLTGDQIGVQQL